MARAIAAVVVLSLLTACAPSVPPSEQRTYSNPESGYRYVTPPHWSFLRGEVRSPNATLITIQAPSVEDADEDFLARSYALNLTGLQQLTQAFEGRGRRR